MFTSRLPTSVRRPTASTDASKSFMGSQRPSSHIPVTVKKANLFTPQTKRYFEPGASTAGKSYMSGATTDRKYNRPLKPLPDRDDQLKMYERLVDYIRRNEPQFPVSEPKKFFSSVSTTESTRIFELLITRIMPGFKINRLETDVPEFLTLVEYPYIRSVTKSALVSVTTRQAVVGLLVIFDWLIGYMNQMESFGEVQSDYQDGSIDEMDELRKNILLHPGRVSEANRDLLNQLYKEQDLDLMYRAYEEDLAESTEICCEIEEIEELIKDRQTIREDKIRCQEYIDKMDVYLQTKRDEGNNLKEQLFRLDVQDEEKIRCTEALELKIKTHELDIDDVRRNQSVLKENEAKLTKLNQRLSEVTIEREKDERTYQRSFKELKEDKDSIINSLKHLVELHNGHWDIQSDELTARREALHDCINNLDRLALDDQKFRHQYTLLILEIKSFHSDFVSQIESDMAEIESQRLHHKDLNKKYPHEIFPKLRDDDMRLEVESEAMDHKHREELMKLERQLEERQRQDMREREKYDSIITNLRRHITIEQERLKGDEEEAASADKLNEEYLENELGRLKQQAMNVLKEVQKEAEQWTQARIVAEENDAVVKTAYHLLRKKLTLP